MFVLFNGRVLFVIDEARSGQTVSPDDLLKLGGGGGVCGGGGGPVR